MSLTLYAHPFSSYSQKVLIALWENAAATKLFCADWVCDIGERVPDPAGVSRASVGEAVDCASGRRGAASSTLHSVGRAGSGLSACATTTA